MADLIVGALAGCFAFLLITYGVFWGLEKLHDILKDAEFV